MGNTTTTVGSNGIGLSGAVFFVFLILKLTGNIDWSWWWVTAPLWAGVGLFLAIAVIIVLGALVWTLVEDRARRRRRALR